MMSASALPVWKTNLPVHADNKGKHHKLDEM